MATMDVERWFFDTNVLIYVTDSTAPLHQTAVTLLLETHQRGIVRTISTQILREFYGFATRTGEQGQNFDRIRAVRALKNIAEFRTLFAVVEDNDNVSLRLFDLVQRIDIGGRQIHDANLVATMLHYGLTHLVTNNPNHFQRFTSLITVVPLVT